MKIQIQHQSLRVRLDERELAQLLGGEMVENHIALAGQGSWRQVVQLNAQPEPTLAGTPDALTIRLPLEAVKALSERLPCRDGLSWELSVGGNPVLQLQFDVDVRDSVRQRGVNKRTDAPITPAA